MFVDESAAAAAHQFATFGIILVVVVLVLFSFSFSFSFFPFLWFQMFLWRLVDYDARPSHVPLHKHERMAMTYLPITYLFFFQKC
jgi:hypothetical protein